VGVLYPLQLLVEIALVVEYVFVLLGLNEIVQFIFFQLRLVYEQFAAAFLLLQLPL
jgi:hypothetical protein